MVTRPDAGLGRDTVTGEPRQATQQQQPGLCGLVVQLQMNIREVFTITEMAPTTWNFSWLKEPTSAFIFKTLC